MKLKKILMTGLLSSASLSVFAMIGTQQAQINNLKPFMVITLVALTLGLMAAYQKKLQHR
jgi:uncharacterized membrane protein YeiH